jgi:hypothetical protein
MQGARVLILSGERKGEEGVCLGSKCGGLFSYLKRERPFSNVQRP